MTRASKRCSQPPSGGWGPQAEVDLREDLLPLAVHRRRHASDDLPRVASSDPGMRDSRCICSCDLASVGLRPIHFDSIMIDRDVAGHFDGAAFDFERLQLKAF